MRMIAIVAALALLQEPETPARNPVRDGLNYLLQHQAPDGSWGPRPARCTCEQQPEASLDGDLEATAWAILAFAGAGYTELSKDDLRGHPIGAAMNGAAGWVLSRQGRDGGFRGAAVPASAAGALALLEIHGMTLLHKAESEKALEWMRATTPTEDRGRVRLGVAWISARSDELVEDPADRLRDLAVSLEAGTGDSARVGALLIRAFAEPRRGRPRVKIDYAAFDPMTLSAEDLNDLTTAWCQMDGGADWHRWYDEVRKRLDALQVTRESACDCGSWVGATLRERMRTTALRCLMLEHYRCYYCRSPFRNAK